MSGRFAHFWFSGPSRTWRTTFSMYAAAITMPSTDTDVCQRQGPYAPSSERNSATKPLRPGSPSEARLKKMRNPA